MEEADTDASDADSSAETQPGGTPSGTDGNPLQEPPAATGSQEGNRTPETGDEGRDALLASAVGGGVIGRGVADRLGSAAC